METLQILTATSAIIIPLILLIIFQLSAKKTMFLSLIIVTLLSFIIWGIDIKYIVSSYIAGTFKAITIIWILFGAIFLLNILRKNKSIDIIISSFKSTTNDKRLQVIIVGFYFVALLEGASGFGAPAAIAGPLLVALGFPPIAAASLALIGNAVSMTFGAVGTPLIDGMGSALVIDHTNIMNIIKEVAIKASFVDLFVGSLVPLVQVVLYVLLFSKDKSFKKIYEIAPFAFISGLIYTSKAYFCSVILGPEFGALLGSLIGLPLVLVLIKHNILLPKYIKENKNKSEYNNYEIIKAWVPYILVVFLLILTRVVKPIKDFMVENSIHIHNILNTEINAKFAWFYSPGFVLSLTAILIIFSYKLSKDDVKESLDLTLAAAKKTSLALIPALAMVYVFLNSGYNINNYLSMPSYLASTLSNIFGANWIYVSPFVGNLGTFIAGSTTTSNIMFSQIQYEVASSNLYNPIKVLTAQALGANTGCMISISKVVSACAVVGLSGKEFKVIRITILVSLIYALLLGVIINLLV